MSIKSNPKSRTLLDRLAPTSALRNVLHRLGHANWVDADHTSGRFLMIALMGCAILTAVAIPYAFEAQIGLFVGA